MCTIYICDIYIYDYIYIYMIIYIYMQIHAYTTYYLLPIQSYYMKPVGTVINKGLKPRPKCSQRGSS